VNDTDKFSEAVCAFANDMPDSKQNGYLLVGVHDDGRLKRRCRYSDAIAYNSFPWPQDANGQETQRTDATKATKRTEGTKATKVTEATMGGGQSLKSLPSLSSLEGGSNG
jgi:predicted HTH transcriptional regulator